MAILRELSFTPPELGSPVESRFGLYTGLYVLAGAAGAGKTVGSAALAGAADCNSAFFYVNEPRGVSLSLRWLFSSLYGSDSAVPTDLELYMHGQGNATLRLPESAPLIVFDSITLWCWFAQQLEMSMPASKLGGQSHLRRSAAMRGGITGEFVRFLLALDAAAVRAHRCVVGTVNTTLYPVGQQHDEDRFEHSVSYRLFKGASTGVITASLIKGGQSYLTISDRADRAPRAKPLTTEEVNAALDLAQQSTSKTGPVSEAEPAVVNHQAFSRL